MMKWHIEGADARTGRDSALTLDAPDEQTAARMARERGLLVAGIKAQNAEPLPYAAAAVAPAMRPDAGPDPGRELSAAARTVVWWAGFVFTVGVLCIIVGGLVIVVGIVESAEGNAIAGVVIVSGIAGAINGFWMLMLGAFLRLAGWMGAAMHTMAYGTAEVAERVPEARPPLD